MRKTARPPAGATARSALFAVLRTALASTLALAAFCAPAYADAGLESLGHVAILVGPFAVGAFEGAAIAYLFRLPGGRTILLLIAANWVSTLAGVSIRLAQGVPTLLGTFDLYMDTLGTARGLVVYWLISLVLETPFCLLALEPDAGRAGSGGRRRWGRALLASALAQTLSYAVLGWIGWEESQPGVREL